MKEICKGLLFWLILLGILLITFINAQVLANAITMNFIIKIAYIMLGFSFIYILKS